MNSESAGHLQDTPVGFKLSSHPATVPAGRRTVCPRTGRYAALLMAALIWILTIPGLSLLSGPGTIVPDLSGPGPIVPGLNGLNGLTPLPDPGSVIPELTAVNRLLALPGATSKPRLFAGHTAKAQRNPAFYSYPYHHLDWYTIESDHFLVHFQEGNSRPAQVISRIAEEIYHPIVELYDHEPDHKISILLIDRLDYSNGAAFFYDNKIEIWLPALDTPLRGTHNWLRNVITHEFAHIVQLQASMKKSRRRPATYLQWLSYEDVRRPDVLYGFPNGIISYPLSGISMPAWMAEGTAQFMRDELYYDDWDSHRDMLLRTRILDSTQLSLETMGTFSSKTSLERELTYNQGFAFIRYMSDRFGEQSIADVTRSFSQRGVYDVREAIREATGTDGKEVYNDWIAERQKFYAEFAEGRESDPANRIWIEPEGFFNFHPVFHPDGEKIAYLSNKLTDGAMAALFVQDFDDNRKSSGLFESRLHETPSLSHSSALRPSGSSKSGIFRPYQSAHPHLSHECSLNTLLMRRLETSFSYSPDGKKIAYSRTRINVYGEQYRDLYVYDTEEESSERITFSERLQDPAWSPDGNFIAAGKIEDGSVNLFFYDISADSLHRITNFQRSEQIYRPVWHPDGNALYFSYADTAQRGIYKLSLDAFPEFTSQQHSPESSADPVQRNPQNQPDSPVSSAGNRLVTPVLTDAVVDYRDPAVSADGAWLYYSADPDGVFNIYRKSLENGQTQQVTNVIGGAFMPHPHPIKEKMLYSEFTSEGYKIALLDLSGIDLPQLSGPASGVNVPQSGQATGQGFSVSALNQFDDRDIAPLSSEAIAVADTGVYHYQIPTRGSSPDRRFYQYNDQFTSFQFYPVIRFDNYSRIRGKNTTLLTQGHMGDLGANLWRDFKFGTYFASREMRERFTIFGGIMIGPGSRPSNGASDFLKPSRLVNLDRDLFLQAEYAGLPFIKRHWSPTVSVEFFNIRRNVQNGLQIEEFPCTACLPDTTSIDIAYDMWEARVNLVSKINRWSLVELGYYYSPYRVSTEAFFSREFRQEIPGSTSRYYIGSTWSAAWIFDLSLPDRHRDIAPTGWRGLIRYRYEPSELLDSYDIRDGSLIPVYNEFDNHSFEADLRFGFDLLNQRFNVRSRFFTYLDGPDEFFYLDYIGGMIGMRSYPYFALGGTTTAFSQWSWFIPLKTNIYRQVGRVTLDKVFLRMFAEAGNGWGGPLDIGNHIKTGVGAELRVAMNSYYLFPTSFFISGAYGFDSYDLQLPDAFITDTMTGRVGYGNQLLVNFGILFDFEF